MDYNVGHATSQPVADDVVVREAEIYTDDESVTPAASLSADEIAHFKARGFIVKRGLIDDDDAFGKVLDHVWNNVPRDIMRRDDVRTWLDAPHEKWTEEDAARVGLLARSNWKMRSMGEEGIGTETFLVDRIANHPRMRVVVEAFIGAPVKRTGRVRGIYCVFPKPIDAPGRYGPHADYMAAHLSAMVIVDEMPAHAGGFTVWPASHLRLHNHWDTVHGGIISADKAEGYRLERDAILRDVTPVEFTGHAGDVIFWHPRILHSAGINCSAEWDTPLVRVIVPCDFQRADRKHFDDLDYGPGPKFQWWVDTRNFREDVPPTPDNVWNDWAI